MKTATLCGPAAAPRYRLTPFVLLMVLVLLCLCAASPRAQAQGGTLVSWGADSYGAVSGTPSGTFSAVAAGFYYSVAIRTDGTLVQWGDSTLNQLNNMPDSSETFSAVAAGYSHNLAIRENGTLVQWGDISMGQSTDMPGPNETFSAVAAGFSHSVAIRTDGTLVSWGVDSGNCETCAPKGRFSSVAAGFFHNVALREDGTLVSWGWDAHGQVSSTPSGTFSAVAARDTHSVALRSNGTLASWGANNLGQQNGLPGSGETFSAVAAGGIHNVALRTDGTLVSWGNDTSPTFLVSSTPCGTFSAVAAGYAHSVAILMVPPTSTENRPPVAHCQNVTVSADATCTANANIDKCSFDPDAGDTIMLSQSPAGPYPLGETSVTLTVTDSQGLTAECTATVHVVDTTPPTLTLSGANPLTVEHQSVFTDPGATASDACAGNLASAIVVTGTVDVNTVGVYTLTYTVSDGQTAAHQDRTVNVVDTTSPPSCLPPPAGLISWWPGDGHANDIIGSNHGTMQNGASFAPGLVGQAFSFDGVDDFVQVPDSTLWAFGLNDFTIEMWVYFDSIESSSLDQPQAVIIGNDEGPNDVNKWALALGGGVLAWHINSPTLGPKFMALAPFTPVVNHWYHLAVSRSGSEYTIFIDGTPAGSETNTDEVPDANAPLTIGQSESPPGNFFMHGRLDEIAIYNRALAAAEIQAIVGAGSAGKCKIASPNQPPVASCHDMTVSADASCMANANVDNGSSDPDAGDSIILSQSPAGPYPLGDTTVTLTVTDSHGLTAQCTATVTVRDTTPPVPNLALLPDVTGQCGATIAAPPTATDNCSGTITGTTTDSLTRTTQGTSVVTWHFNDGHGNISTQTQQIVVTDTTPPVAKAQSVASAEDTAKLITLTATDNCVASVTYSLVAGPSHGTLSGLPNTTGKVTYTPAANYNGSDSFSFQANDGALDSNVATVSIAVAAVNDAPSFMIGPGQTVLEDAGTQTVNGWATLISPGPVDESRQAVNFIVTNNKNALFAVQPAVNATGDLTYSPAANANGSATVSVRIHDDGGTAKGGVDTSAIQTFTITVTPVNDVPSFTKGPDQTVLEDAGAQTVNGWATGISAGPANESSQAVNFLVSNDNNALFSAQPAVNANGRLTYTPAANANGSAMVTVRIHDNGGTMPGIDTSTPQTFTITVTPVNDAPTLANPGNKSVAELTVLNFTLVGADSDAGQTLTYSISSGLLTGMNLEAATGIFSWTPSEEQGPGTYPVTFRVTDNGTPQLFAERTIAIAVKEVNQAPTLYQPPTSAFYYEGFPITFRLVGIDPDLPANKLTYSFVSGKQAGMILDSATADFSWTPSEAQGPGTYQVTFRAKDNGIPALSGDLTMTITVAEVNQSPILTNPGNQTVKKNKNLQFTLKATDPDSPANTLTFGMSSGYPGMTLNGASFSWTPTSAGTFNNVTFYVMDNGTPILSSYQSITITVTP